MGFRIFDLSTPLYSPRGRAVGRDWFDLVIHTLKRGVDVHLALADFDPVVAAETHRLTWRSIRMLVAAAEVARGEGAAGRLHAAAAMHPASVSPVASNQRCRARSPSAFAASPLMAVVISCHGP